MSFFMISSLPFLCSVSGRDAEVLADTQVGGVGTGGRLEGMEAMNDHSLPSPGSLQQQVKDEVVYT